MKHKGRGINNYPFRHLLNPCPWNRNATGGRSGLHFDDGVKICYFKLKRNKLFIYYLLKFFCV